MPVRPSRTYRPTTREIIAHRMTNKAVADGLLKKAPCCACGSTNALQAHHEDYHQPNCIAWLCSSCHRSRHGYLGWGLSGGTLDHLQDNHPPYHILPHYVSPSDKHWSAESKALLQENKEWELMWLLEKYGCVEIKTAKGFSHLLQAIYESVFQKHRLRVERSPMKLHITLPS